jgi:nicotinate-nucleotide pyrophosphorylase (carboxylating)
MHLTIEQDVANALQEDIGPGDITGALIPSNLLGFAKLHAREPAVVCGQAWADEVLRQVSADLTINWLVEEGSYQPSSGVWAHIKGPLSAMLTAERTALNFLQTLSAVATKTHRYVELLKETKTKILDTRKTIPGLRLAEKYAVRCGGGFNHRIGLYDEYLIKENHIQALGSLENAVQLAKKHRHKQPIVVEVQTIEEFSLAQSLGVDRIMLDNFSNEMIAQAVSMNKGIRCPIEVSGGINDARIQQLAALGIDYVSVGDLTKSIKAIDLSLLVQAN